MQALQQCFALGIYRIRLYQQVSPLILMDMTTLQVVPPRRGETMNQRLAQELNALKARYSLSQTELGKVIGVTQSQMSKRLKGHVPFTLDEIEAFAAFFSMTPLELLGYAETPGPGGQGPSGASTLVRSYRTSLSRAA